MNQAAENKTPAPQQAPEGKQEGSDPSGLAAWMQNLGEAGMPAFAHTARDIANVSQSRESSAAELARVVLQDAAMTARLLRVANSPMFNPIGRAISTVSRAVVVLGFDEVRSICLSIAIVESLLRGKQKERVVKEMARSFHAAVQARAFAKKRNDSSPEEVFIATLLYHLGDMAFWSCAVESAERLDARMQQRPGEAPEEAQREILGFTLRELTLGLGREWRLGELLEHSLEGRQDKDPRAGNVTLGHELAAAVEHGWNTTEVKDLLGRISESLYLPVDEVEKMVADNAEEAATTAAFYGANRAGCLIPVPGARGADQQAVEEEPETPEFPEPDPMLQLTILRELSSMMESKPDLNLVLEMVLEGVYRGIGMDRTLFALRSPDHRFLMGRYALGADNETLRRHFQFATDKGRPDVFTHAMERRESLWVSDQCEPAIEKLVTPEVHAVTQGAAFFVTPIEIRGKVIGLYYADRLPSGRRLDEESFASFKHFTQQGNLALTYLNSGG